MNKNLIQKRFAKNLNTYNDNAKIQKIMAEIFVPRQGKQAPLIAQDIAQNGIDEVGAEFPVQFFCRFGVGV